MMSSANRSALAVRDRGPANSVRYSPVRMPIGSAISAPNATISSVPSRELKIPPPASPEGFWSTKLKLSADAPRTATP